MADQYNEGQLYHGFGSNEDVDSGAAEQRARGSGNNLFDAGGLLGFVSGRDSQFQHAESQRLADERERWWSTIHSPTASELTPEYDYNARGGAEGLSAQEAALGQLGQWAHGGLTGADRAMMESTRMRDAQASASQRQAIMQQMQARGMGGSGADLATQMMASQLGQQQASDAESQMMQGAQQRALAAVQAQAQLGGNMRQLGQHETETQQNAVRDARQQAFEDRATQAAGANNAATGLQQAYSQQHQQQQQQNNQTLQGIGQGISAFATLASL